MVDLEFACDERRGYVVRHVLEVEATPMAEMYLRLHLDDMPSSPMKDISHIYSYGARLFLVDDVGMMLKGTIDFGGLVDVHIGFWDRVLRGREQMCRYMAELVAHDAGIRGVWTAMPPSARATLAFAKRIGFTEASHNDSAVVLTLIT